MVQEDSREDSSKKALKEVSQGGEKSESSYKFDDALAWTTLPHRQGALRVRGTRVPISWGYYPSDCNHAED